MKKSLFCLIPLFILVSILFTSCDEEVSNSHDVISEDDVIELFDVYHLNQESDDYYETDSDDVNRISAFSVDSDETTAEMVLKYVDMAAGAGIHNVIVNIEKEVSFDVLKEKLFDAVKRAEKADVGILFETQSR